MSHMSGVCACVCGDTVPLLGQTMCIIQFASVCAGLFIFVNMCRAVLILLSWRVMDRYRVRWTEAIAPGMLILLMIVWWLLGGVTYLVRLMKNCKN